MPIPPEQMVTTVKSNNKTYQTFGLGEVNLIKNISLRNIFLKFLLPNDLTLPFVQKQYSVNCILSKPISYISKIRELREQKRPIRFIITRVLPNQEEIFSGNLLVSIEDYVVYENASENGDFWVDLNLKEYKELIVKELTPISNKNYSITNKRTSKQTSKSYTVKSGDTLWKIAKLELNDATKWKQIADLNNIQDAKSLKIGQVLNLP